MKWLRTIDSAQRVIRLEQPVSPSHSQITQLDFSIQGVNITEAERQWRDKYPEMAQRGIDHEGQKPLTIMQRLMRKETPIGHLLFDMQDKLAMTLWTQPRLVLHFDLNDQEQADLFRECEILILSAGFHFNSEGAEDRVYKG